MSHFESTSGSEGVLKAQTEPFPVLESRARLFCELPPRRVYSVSRAFQLRARAAGGKTCATCSPCVLLYSWAWRQICEEAGEWQRREEEGGTPCARAPSPHESSLFLRSRRRTFFSAAFKCEWPGGSAACHMTTASRAQSIALRISPTRSWVKLMLYIAKAM